MKSVAPPAVTPAPALVAAAVAAVAEEKVAAEEEEEESEEELWPADADPYVDGRLYGLQPAPPGLPAPGRPIKAVLSSRASYGSGDVLDGDSALGPVMPFCPYCMRLGLMMQEAGVPYDTYLIDSQDKPEWFLEAFAAGTTPAMLGTPGGLDTGEWAGGYDACVARLRQHSAAFASWHARPASAAAAAVAHAAGLVAFSSICSLIAESDSSVGILTMLGKKVDAEFVVAGETGAARKTRLLAMVTDGLAHLEALVAALDGKWFGGDAPAETDVQLVSMLVVANCFVEAGLCGLPASPCSLETLGAPSLLPYLQRWAGRASYRHSYQHAHVFSSVMVMSIAHVLVAMAPEATGGGQLLAPIMQRARQLDPLYDGVDRRAAFANA